MLFGVGNKNFRIVCDEEFKNNLQKKVNFDKSKYRCNTHPHQIYIEILSEHGLFGFISFLIFLILFIKYNFFKIIYKKDLVLISFFLVLLVNFLPILPGGSFFSSFNATIFWVNFSLFYAYKKIII